VVKVKRFVDFVYFGKDGDASLFGLELEVRAACFRLEQWAHPNGDANAPALVGRVVRALFPLRLFLCLRLPILVLRLHALSLVIETGMGSIWACDVIAPPLGLPASSAQQRGGRLRRTWEARAQFDLEK
jgi:hypothetical protein